MDKKILIRCGFIVILAIIIGLGIGNYVHEPKHAINSEQKYYFYLSKGCRHKQSASCCMASVRAMMGNKYKCVPESGCPEGSHPSMLRCNDSYHWCEPNNKSAVQN